MIEDKYEDYTTEELLSLADAQECMEVDRGQDD